MRGSGAMPLRFGVCATMLAAIGLACWSPTEIELDVSTDVSCSGDIHTQIFLSPSTATVGSADGCSDLPSGRIGSFVVAPSGSRESHVDVQVALARGRTHTPDQCIRDDSLPDCIVARRAFAFTKHQSQYVGVRLYQQCFGHHCSPDSTCVPDALGIAQCVSASVAPTDQQTFDVGNDAAAPPSGCPRAGQVVAEVAEPASRLFGYGNFVFWLETGARSIASVRKDGSSATPTHFMLESEVTAIALSPTHTRLAVLTPSSVATVDLDPDAGPSTVNKPAVQPFPSACGAYTAIGVNDAAEIFLGTAVGTSNACLSSSSTNGWSGYSAGQAAVTALASFASQTFFWADGQVLGKYAPSGPAPSNVAIGALELLASQQGGVLFLTAQEVGVLSPSLDVQWRAPAPGAHDLAGTTSAAYYVAPQAAGGAAILAHEPSGAEHVVARGGTVHGTVVDGECVYYWADGKILAAAP